MTEPFEDAGIVGFFHSPGEPSGDALVLTHGAGSNCRSALLVALAAAFCDAGWYVLRCDLAFRQRRPSGPPHPSHAAGDREGLREAMDALKGRVGGRICLGGHSYGGRQGSMLLAEDPALAAGLLLLSYPLHPPKQPDRLRTAHFEKLQTPSLFVHGMNDPFASPDELRQAVRSLSGPHHLTFVDGAGHDLKNGRFATKTDVVEPFRRLLDKSASDIAPKLETGG